MPSKILSPLLTLAFLLLCGGESLQAQQWIPKKIVGMDYPKPSNWAAIKGQVKVSFTINHDGSVRTIKAEGNPHPLLFKAVKDNASQWIFMETPNVANLQDTTVLVYSFDLTQPCSDRPQSHFQFEYPDKVSITSQYACTQTSRGKTPK